MAGALGALCPRLIPAWAGKTSPFRSARPPSRAHPRVGGENSPDPNSDAICFGSSPRGRGKLEVGVVPGGAEGLIPAWAGKTRCAQGATVACRAHPRVGGENYQAVTFYRSSRGSSPRGRGKRAVMTSAVCPTRLIPAWAGKTPCATSLRMTVAAHPRVGGENLFMTLLT